MPKPAAQVWKITEHVCFRPANLQRHGSLNTDAYNDLLFKTVSGQTGLCVASELHTAGLLSVQHSETVHMKNKWVNV